MKTDDNHKEYNFYHIQRTYTEERDALRHTFTIIIKLDFVAHFKMNFDQILVKKIFFQMQTSITLLHGTVKLQSLIIWSCPYRTVSIFILLVKCMYYV